jgi:hypothetical protein
MPVRRVALLTAGGLAPCLSSAVGGLIERYTAVAPDVEIIAYLNGYHGLLSGQFLEVTPEVREKAALLHKFGGSPIGNSRVKLTNTADLVKRGSRTGRTRCRSRPSGSSRTASTSCTPSAVTTPTPPPPTSRRTCRSTTTT